jgi:hypothetical protein
MQVILYVAQYASSQVIIFSVQSGASKAGHTYCFLLLCLKLTPGTFKIVE